MYIYVYITYNLRKCIPFQKHFCSKISQKKQKLHFLFRIRLWCVIYNFKCIQTVIDNGEGNGISCQYSCLDNPMDGGASQATVHGVSKSWTRLRDFTFTFHFHALEKEMATYSSVLAWRIPGTGEPGGLLSMGSHRVGHN